MHILCPSLKLWIFISITCCFSHDHTDKFKIKFIQLSRLSSLNMLLLLFSVLGSALAKNLGTFSSSPLSFRSTSQSVTEQTISAIVSSLSQICLLSPSPPALATAFIRIPCLNCFLGLQPCHSPVHSSHCSWRDFYEKASLILSLHWLKLSSSSP